ncbi:MAG: YggS family pyridoxal phosphate-dependent enzyme [Sphaerochaetaceae bacterium]|nr:YggS family pyridoxal phosphate-dependent enzyme [Sphaerochaetaceae bacterium]
MVRLDEVRRELEEVCKKAGRENEVSLMAVSKLHTYEDILECYSKGQRLFGENHVQEIQTKFPSKESRPEGMYLCLIGHLQSNKVKKVLPLVDRIDSVDSLKLLLLIEKELEKMGEKRSILFELNSSDEEQKSGFKSEAELFEAVDQLANCPHVTLEGIMTVGPLGSDVEKNRKAFIYTREVFRKVQKVVPTATILSMGMSGDYVEAIEEGSTLVRIGTAIFGERNYNV